LRASCFWRPRMKHIIEYAPFRLLNPVSSSIRHLLWYRSLFPCQYAQDEEVILWVNKIGPYYNPQETYTYYTLPFCRCVVPGLIASIRRVLTDRCVAGIQRSQRTANGAGSARYSKATSLRVETMNSGNPGRGGILSRQTWFGRRHFHTGIPAGTCRT
jgi:hypothetical protein